MPPDEGLQTSIQQIQIDLATIKALIQERERGVEDNRRNIGLLDKELRSLTGKLAVNDEETHKIDVQFDNFKKEFEKNFIRLDARIESIERHLSSMTEMKTQFKMLWTGLGVVAAAVIGGFIKYFSK
jgi:chromosome segregation ATPase